MNGWGERKFAPDNSLFASQLTFIAPFHGDLGEYFYRYAFCRGV
jgi:hypothetical protein